MTSKVMSITLKGHSSKLKLVFLFLLMLGVGSRAVAETRLPAWKPKIYIADQEFTPTERWLNGLNDWFDIGYDARKDNSKCPEVPTPGMNRYKTNQKMDGFQVYKVYSFRHLMNKGDRALRNREFCKATDYYGHARTSARTDRQDMSARLRRAEAFFNISDYTGAINEANRFLAKFGRTTKWSEYAHYLILRAVSRQCQTVGTDSSKCKLGLYLDPEQKKISSPALLNLSFYSYLSIYKRFKNSQRYKQVQVMARESEIVYGKTLLSVAKYNYRQASVGHSDGLFSSRQYPKFMYYRAAGDRYFKVLGRIRNQDIRSVALYCSVDSYMQIVRLASQARMRQVDLLNFFMPRDKKTAMQIRQARKQRKKLLKPVRQPSGVSLRDRMKARFIEEGRFHGLLKIVFERAQKRTLKGITRGVIKHQRQKAVNEMVLRAQDIADVGYLLMEFNMPDHPLTARARRLIFKNRLTPKRMSSERYKSYLRRTVFLPKSECSKNTWFGISDKASSWLNWSSRSRVENKNESATEDFFKSLFSSKSKAKKSVRKKRKKKIIKKSKEQFRSRVKNKINNRFKNKSKKRKTYRKKTKTTVNPIGDFFASLFAAQTEPRDRVSSKKKRKKTRSKNDSVWAGSPFGI